VRVCVGGATVERQRHSLRFRLVSIPSEVWQVLHGSNALWDRASAYLFYGLVTRRKVAALWRIDNIRPHLEYSSMSIYTLIFFVWHPKS